MIKINLLAEAKPTKKKKGVAALGAAGRLNILLLAGAFAIGVIAVAVQWWILNSKKKELEEKIRVAQAEVTRLEAILKEVKDFEDKKARLQKKVDLINQLQTNQKGPVRLMDEVSKALPDLLWLEKMEHRGNTIFLEGKALNPNAVANYLENLKKVPSFQEPKVGVVQACQAGSTSLYCFNLNFVFSNLDKARPEAAPSPTPAPAPGAPAGGASPPGKAERSVPPSAMPAAIAAPGF